MNSFTPNQKKSLDFNRNIALSAGAGSGKTTVLIARIVHMLRTIDAFYLKNLVAITFTIKAANEMRSRLRQALLVAHRNETNPALKKKLQLSLYQINQAQISTIDAFLKRILERYAIELNIDPEFGILSKRDRKKHIKLLINQTFNTRYQNRDEHFIELFTVLGQFQLTNILEASLYKNFNSLSTNPQALVAFWLELEATYTSEILQQINADTALPLLIKKSEQCAPISSLAKSFQEQFNHLQLAIELFKGGQPLDAIPLFKQALLTANGQVRAFYLDPKKFAEQDHSVFSQLAEKIAFFAQKILPRFSEFDKNYLNLFSHFIALRESVENAFNERKRELGLFEFKDLLTLTSQLFKIHPEAILELRRDFQFFMIDEFQDTNFQQWQVLFPLLSSAKVPELLDRQRLFLVGDPKQSIYGFRNANVAVFSHVQHAIVTANQTHKTNNLAFQDHGENSEIESNQTEKDGLIYLGKNYRTQTHKVEFFNHLFQRVFEIDRNEFDVEFTPLFGHKVAENTDVQSYFLNRTETGSTKEEALFIAQTILSEIKAGRQFSDIAILLRTRPSHNEIQDALRDYNIPFISLLGDPLFEQQAVFDVYNFLRFAVFPHDDIALIGVLKSPLFNFSDLQLFELSKNNGKTLFLKLAKANPSLYERLNNARTFAQSNTVKAIIEHFFLQGDYSAKLHSNTALQSIDYIQQLIQFIENELPAERCDLFSAVSLIEEQIKSDDVVESEMDQNTNINAVKCMTIHSAKGLEFPVVFLPYLHKSFYKRIDTDIMIDSLGIYSSAFRTKDDLQKMEAENTASFIEAYFKLKERQKGFAEEKRVLYVAMTRAEDQLYLSSSHKTNKNDEINVSSDSFAGFIDEALGGLTSPLKSRIFSVQTAFEKPHTRDSINPVLEIANDLKTYFQKKHTLSSENEFSATEITTFLHSKDDYKNKYFMGLFEEDFSYTPSSKSAKKINASLFGTIVHDVLEFTAKVSQTDELIKTVLEKRNIYSEELAQNINQHISQFLQSEKTQEIQASIKKHHELPIRLPIGADFLYGILDLVVYDGKNWKVIDFKTNAVSKTDFQLLAKEKYLTQMKFYALLLSSFAPSQEKIEVQLYFTAIDRVYSQSFNLQELTDYKAELSNHIEAIKNLETQVL